MTDTSRIEPRLLEEVERLEREGDAEQRLPVLVSHASDPGSEMEQEGVLERGSFETEVTRRLEGLRERLREAGVDAELRALALANALAGDLTPAEIRAAADVDGVKRIVWNRPERVEL